MQFDHLIVFIDISDIQNEADHYTVINDRVVASADLARFIQDPINDLDSLKHMLKVNTLSFHVVDIIKD